MRTRNLLITTALLILPTQSHAWGRRGHSLVGEAAAYLVSGEPNALAVRAHAYDLGYYCNTPDFFWKVPATYAFERPQHYMDMEIFEREFKLHPDIKKPFELSRAEFLSSFPQIKPEAGGAYWRIREFFAEMQKASDQLHALKEPKGKERQDLQAKWVLYAGLIGHYVGDLAQPLHTTESPDGQATSQNGIHSFFEDVCVDEIYPQLVQDVNATARRRWTKYRTSHADKSVLALVEELADESHAALPELLAIDKSHPRENVHLACSALKKMIVSGLRRAR